MERLGLFLLLVIALPFAAYWVTNDGPGDFVADVRALRGTRPPPDPTRAPEPEPEADPEPEPDRPDPEPDPEPEPEPKPDPEPEPPPEDPLVKAHRLFGEGRFLEAARAFAGENDFRQGLALLGAAFVAAFPKVDLQGDYLVIETRFGATDAGYAEERRDSVKLTDPTGKTTVYPISVLSKRTRMTGEAAVDFIANEVRTEGETANVTGKRLFALIHKACAIGRPDAMAPLLERVIEIDEEKPFFLSAVRERVAPEHQGRLYRAFTVCELPRLQDVVEVPRVPRKLGNGGGDTRPVPRDHPKGKLKNAKARALVDEARPLSVAGLKIYRKVMLAGVDNADIGDVNEAIRMLQKSLDLCEKAVLIEDSDMIYGMMRPVSRYLFQLRFWKQTMEAR